MLRRLSFCLTFLVYFCCGFAVAQPIGSTAAVRQLPIKPKANAYRPSGWKEPLVVKDAEEAATYFQKAELAKLLDEMDFERQVALVFAWRGSGQDRIDYDVQESLPEQVVFSYTPGRTKDLRRNSSVFALRSNVTWKIKDKSSEPPAARGDYIKVEVKGELNSQVVAIGGETTGIQITSRGATFELDFAGTPSLRQKAERLHGQTVIARGSLTVKSGVEIAKRWILSVEAIHDGSPNSEENAFLTPNGLLRYAIELKESQTGFAGDSGHIWKIANDGRWQHATFLNSSVSAADRQGRLTKVQLQALANQLSRSGFPRLPLQLGRDPGVNPKVVSLKFGPKRVAITLSGGTDLREEIRRIPESPERRFLALVLFVLDCT